MKSGTTPSASASDGRACNVRAGLDFADAVYLSCTRRSNALIGRFAAVRDVDFLLRPGRRFAAAPAFQRSVLIGQTDFNPDSRARHGRRGEARDTDSTRPRLSPLGFLVCRPRQLGR
jgi:hypothetical protein